MTDYLILGLEVLVLVMSGFAVVYFGKQIYRDWKHR